MHISIPCYTNSNEACHIIINLVSFFTMNGTIIAYLIHIKEFFYLNKYLTHFKSIYLGVKQVKCSFLKLIFNFKFQIFTKSMKKTSFNKSLLKVI